MSSETSSHHPNYRRWSEEELIQAVLRVTGGEFMRPSVFVATRTSEDPTLLTLSARFGDYYHALQAAGISVPEKKLSRRKIPRGIAAAPFTRAMVEDALRRAAQGKDVLTVNAYEYRRRAEDPSYRQIREYYGTWNEVLVGFGLIPGLQRYNEAEMIEALRRVHERAGGTSNFTIRLYEQHRLEDEPSAMGIRRSLGNWNWLRSLQVAGIYHNQHDLSMTVAMESVQEVLARIDRPEGAMAVMSAADYDRLRPDSFPSARAIMRAFEGSWSDVAQHSNFIADLRQARRLQQEAVAQNPRKPSIEQLAGSRGLSESQIHELLTDAAQDGFITREMYTAKKHPTAHPSVTALEKQLSKPFTAICADAGLTTVRAFLADHMDQPELARIKDALRRASRDGRLTKSYIARMLCLLTQRSSRSKPTWESVGLMSNDILGSAQLSHPTYLLAR